MTEPAVRPSTDTTAAADRAPKRRRPGGRSARVREAVLAATLGQLLASGYDDLSVAAVAEQAGVSVPTVYRRWSTKAGLAAAALGEFVASTNPIPDTGTFEGDLRALLSQVLVLLRRPEVERLVRAVAAIDPLTPGAEEARGAFWHSRFAGSAEIVRRAIERQEVSAGTAPEAVIEFLVGPAYLRVLVTRGPLDHHLEDESVRRTLSAYARV